jgi:MSHA biogenesis protein MshQ
METQYLNSAGLYIAIAQDSCTTLSSSDLSFAFVAATPNLVACETSITPVTTLYFTSGKVSGAVPPATTPLARLTKPGAGNNGAVDITVNLLTGSGNSCMAGTSSAATGANKPWLQWKWSGATYDKNPTARATFGVFKNADEFIYLRENF